MTSFNGGPSQSAMKVYVDTPYFFIGLNNTDWQHMHSLRHLGRYCPVETYFPIDVEDILVQSISYAFLRFGISLPRMLDPRSRKLRARSLRRRSIDVVLTHSIVPQEVDPIPVVWQSAVLDPTMHQANGASAAEIRRQELEFEALLPRAAAVQVCTEAEAERMAKTFAGHAEKFVSVPLFLPHLIMDSVEDIKRKHLQANRIEVLFVGKDGRRKGLDLLLDALPMLEPAIRSKIHLTVVSKWKPNQLDLCGVKLEYHRRLPRKRVLELMKRSHIFAMPSRFESFGLVYIEAMARGCAIIAPNWEVQREITGYGLAGVNVPPTVEDILGGIRGLFDVDKRLDIALNARDRVQTHYSPTVVARKYLDMFEFARSMKPR